MQLVSSYSTVYVPSHHLAVWPCNAVPVKDPHFIDIPVAQWLEHLDR